MQIEEKVDIVLVTASYTEHYAPLPAIAILKSVAEKAGMSAKAIDLNQKYSKRIVNDLYCSQIVDWFLNETYHPEIENTITKIVDDMADEIMSYSPKIVGISVFSYANQIGAKYLAIAIKERDPNIKIIMGGQGLFDNVGGEGKYIEGLQEMKLLDNYFVNDAEQTFYKWLLGEKIEEGMHHKDWDKQTGSALTKMSFPSYDDHDFAHYREPIITINSSRGCVRKCKFCSDIVRWQKYQYRKGVEIFDEMLHQIKKYNVTKFYFTDPLINGNVREFRVLINLIAKYNRENPNGKISYYAAFIFRPQNQFTPEDWEVLAESNPYRLQVGIESLDEDVRFHMGKKFNQADLGYGLDHCLKHNIYIEGNMIVGYPTEDQHSVDKAKKWLANNTKYQPILEFGFGGTMMLLPGTYISENQKEMGIKSWGPPYYLWTCEKSGSSPKKRFGWWKELMDTAKLHGWTVTNGIENSAIIDKIMHMDPEMPLENYKYSEGDRAVNLDQYAKDLGSNHNLPAN